MIDGEEENADAIDQDENDRTIETQDARLVSLRRLQDEDVFHAGAIPRAAIASWADAVTDAVVIPGKQRNWHYLVRHPEIYEDEALLLRTLVDPDEVHANKIDLRMAIVYKQIDQEYSLRIALWISNRIDRQNSVLSVRRAGIAKIQTGRSNGRRRWEK